MLGFSLLCLVGVQNATNMADGKDGLAIGLSLLWTGLLFAHAPDHLRPLLLVLAVGLALVLIFNLSGRLFLGDSGSYSISAFVGLATIYCYGVGFPVLRADVVALWFLIPVVDCLRLMAVRLARGRSPFSSDQNHLHHILTRWMPWRWGLPLYLALVGLPSLVGVLAAEPGARLGAGRALDLWRVARLGGPTTRSTRTQYLSRRRLTKHRPGFDVLTHAGRGGTQGRRMSAAAWRGISHRQIVGIVLGLVLAAGVAFVALLVAFESVESERGRDIQLDYGERQLSTVRAAALDAERLARTGEAVERERLATRIEVAADSHRDGAGRGARGRGGSRVEAGDRGLRLRVAGSDGRRAGRAK